MDKNICLHGIYAKSELYDSASTLRILKQILKSDALLSRRMQNRTKGTTYFNGIDYISLCDYSKRTEKYISKFNAYEGYIRYSLSLMFPKDKLPIITPEMVDLTYDGSLYDYREMARLGALEGERYSDLPDEVQVKDAISLDLMNGITLPLNKVRFSFISSRDRNIDYALREIDKLITLLAKHNRLVPIYDIDTFTRIDNEENVKTLIKTRQKQYRG